MTELLHFNSRTGAYEMDYINGTWKMNAFADYFQKSCVIDDCEKKVEDEKEKARNYYIQKFNYDKNNRIIECMTTFYSLSYSQCEDTDDKYYGKTANDSASVQQVIVEINKLTTRCDQTTQYRCSLCNATSCSLVPPTGQYTGQ